MQWINSWWWTDELSETCRISRQNKFVKLVHLVGFITNKFVTIHGHTNVKLILPDLFNTLNETTNWWMRTSGLLVFAYFRHNYCPIKVGVRNWHRQSPEEFQPTAHHLTKSRRMTVQIILWQRDAGHTDHLKNYSDAGHTEHLKIDREMRDKQIIFWQFVN